MRNSSAHHPGTDDGGVVDGQHRPAAGRTLVGFFALEEKVDQPGRVMALDQFGHGIAFPQQTVFDLTMNRVGDNFHGLRDRRIETSCLSEHLAFRHDANDCREEVFKAELQTRTFLTHEASGKYFQILHRHDMADESRMFCGAGVEQLAGGDEVECFAHTDDARQPRGAAPGRQNAKLGLWQADLGAFVIAGDAPVTGEGDFKAAAHAGPMNRGDLWHVQPS